MCLPDWGFALQHGHGFMLAPHMSGPVKKARYDPIQSKIVYSPVAPGCISAFRCTKPHVLTPNSHCVGSV